MRQLMWPAFERSGPAGGAAVRRSWPRNPTAGARRARAPAPSGRCSSCRPPAAASASARTAPASTPATTRAPRPTPRPPTSTSACAELNSSIELSLAAYNGGEGRARACTTSRGGRNFWDDDVYNQFPAGDQGLRADGDRRGVAVPASEGIRTELPEGRRAPGDAPAGASPASIYELTICLGNGGTRDGYMRALRNLNPRYEADSWICRPARTLNATTKMAASTTAGARRASAPTWRSSW